MTYFEGDAAQGLEPDNEVSFDRPSSPPFCRPSRAAPCQLADMPCALSS